MFTFVCVRYVQYPCDLTFDILATHIHTLIAVWYDRSSDYRYVTYTNLFRKSLVDIVYEIVRMRISRMG